MLAFVTAWVACLIVFGVAFLLVSEPVVVTWLFTLRGVLVVLGAALVFSLLYWGLAQRGARDRLFAAMHCRPLDPGDRYHERLANIVEEMRIATGGPHIQCVTVRTVGFNAFAFSDLHGGGVIGVTEGALARLSRQQLQAVVAHEFAHVLSGGYVTVTVSCLLFGIYSSLVEKLDEAADAGLDTDAASAALGMVPLRSWLWLMELRVVGGELGAQPRAGEAGRPRGRALHAGIPWPWRRRCASSGNTPVGRATSPRDSRRSASAPPARWAGRPSRGATPTRRSRSASGRPGRGARLAGRVRRAGGTGG